MSPEGWTYGVHTIALQEQVARGIGNLPVLTGRRNHPCLIGRETHGMPVNADQAICAAGAYCEYTGRRPKQAAPQDDWDRYEKHGLAVATGAVPRECDYYHQRREAFAAKYRITNYSLFLADDSLVEDSNTPVLLADEAHNLEDAICNAAEFVIYAPSLRRFGIDMPDCETLAQWIDWARETRGKLPPVSTDRLRERPDWGLITVTKEISTLAEMNEFDASEWVVVRDGERVHFQPIWGRQFVGPKLLRQGYVEDGAGINKVIFTSATLMGAEYIADLLGLHPSDWAYLDLPSTFPPEHRPINYAPVVQMNRERMSTAEGRAPMQKAIDGLIGYYISTGRGAGIVHAVSNKYRDLVLTESRFRDILTIEREVHEARVRAGEASVLVSANSSEGYDGVDDLCRFVVMPKVPFPNLGDPRIAARREADPRSYDHKALVAVVQGAGRGVRHATDTSDTWILDRAWAQLYKRRRDWLPTSFTDAYHDHTSLPWENK